MKNELPVFLLYEILHDITTFEKSPLYFISRDKLLKVLALREWSGRLVGLLRFNNSEIVWKFSNHQ